MKQKRAYNQGFDAACHGHLESTNPYSAHDHYEMWDRWLDGFYEAFGILQIADS